MNEAEARRRFTGARVASLATVDSAGVPHIVPVTFAVDGGTIVIAVDAKPKRSTALRRHANIAAHPEVSLLVQHWDEDWSTLWWVRADGIAVVTESATATEHAVRLLRGKYPQYQSVDVHGPVIEVTVRTWRGWSAAP